MVVFHGTFVFGTINHTDNTDVFQSQDLQMDRSKSAHSLANQEIDISQLLYSSQSAVARPTPVQGYLEWNHKHLRALNKFLTPDMLSYAGKHVFVWRCCSSTPGRGMLGTDFKCRVDAISEYWERTSLFTYLEEYCSSSSVSSLVIEKTASPTPRTVLLN